MPRLLVPPMEPEGEEWPTLGYELCDWIEARCVHGPGDIRGQRPTLTTEEVSAICRAYEVYPRDHEMAGRRRFSRVALSRRKGWRKTELAAWLAIAELDDEAPVRCDGWRKHQGVWIPVGRSVTDPYIPMCAVTLDQVEDLAYGAVCVIIEESPDLCDRYDVGLERVMPLYSSGELKPVASAPSGRDGARTTFQHFDETHLFVLPSLRKAHATMLRNQPKRKIADAWSLETTTMYGPGEQSVAENTHTYAEGVADGTIADSRLLYDHLEASESHDIEIDEGLTAAIVEASGDALEWANIPAILAQFRDPTSDEGELIRYWLNRPHQSEGKWMPPPFWRQVEKPNRKLKPGEKITLGFDGSQGTEDGRIPDWTVLVGCCLTDGHLFVAGAWFPPEKNWKKWRPPRREVMATIRMMHRDFDVVRGYGDPPYWQAELDKLQTEYRDRDGKPIWVPWETTRPKYMAEALDRFHTAVVTSQVAADGEIRSEISHDGDGRLEGHVLAAITREDRKHTTIGKPDHATKIDLAVGATLAYEARADAIAAGALRRKPAKVSFA